MPAQPRDPVLSASYVNKYFGIDRAVSVYVPSPMRMMQEMAAAQINSNNRRTFATVSEIRDVFHEHRSELEWLAYFITGDKAIAAACVTEACELSESHRSVFTEWLLTWARHATTRSAIDTQHARIKQVCARYDGTTLSQPRQQPLTEETLEVLTRNSEFLVAKLDVVARSVLVISGMQKHSIADAALMLGVSRAVASAAYRVALDFLEVIRCELIAQESGNPVVCN